MLNSIRELCFKGSSVDLLNLERRLRLTWQLLCNCLSTMYCLCSNRQHSTIQGKLSYPVQTGEEGKDDGRGPNVCLPRIYLHSTLQYSCLKISNFQRWQDDKQLEMFIDDWCLLEIYLSDIRI